MAVEDFKNKARLLIFKTSLKDFPVIFEMYLKSFDLFDKVDVNEASANIIKIIRTSENAETAKVMVYHYLDGLELP